jgi:H+/Cl- antiporter ClcA
MADAAPPELSPEQADATLKSKAFVGLLVIVAFVGVVVSVAAWCFLELIYQIQQELYTHLPNALGYHNGPPQWWPLPILAIAGVIVALAITRLPGNGGHIPAEGFATGSPALPKDLPGVVLAGLATISTGIVLGPEAPLIAIGAALGVLTISLARRDTPHQVLVVVGAAGSFAALSFIFTSPLVAAVILIEATAIGGPRLRLVLVPGLLAAGIGTLVSIGIGSFTGLSTSAYSLGPLQLPAFNRPHLSQFFWTLALAIVVAIIAQLIMRGGLLTHRFVSPRPLLLLLPVIGLITAGLAIAFSQATGKSINEMLFSGQDALPGLVAHAGTWSLSALALLIVFKGAGYSLALGSFRGGPTFPALYLGAAGGIMASHLAGFPLTPAVAVGIGAATVSILRLPLSAVVLATVLTAKSGPGAEPLIIVGVVVSYLVTLLVSGRRTAAPATHSSPSTS